MKELMAARHDIHKHPELGFEETRTQAKIRSWLIDRGYQPFVSAKTGLVADLFPERYGETRTIALRADMDCLPMQEDTPLPYRSVHDGRAHKCGHDGHTAILLGVADILATHKASIPGNVRLVFQPDEEGQHGGGAPVMVKEGVLQSVDEIYGLHNWPAWPMGEVRVKAGPLMAHVVLISLKVVGKGGHGSQPQVTRDPIVAASHMVTGLQTVVSRGLGFEGGAVVSICQFHGGNAHNVIPETVQLGGTIRTFSEEVTRRVLDRVEEIARGVEVMFGVRVELQIQRGYPVLRNHDECVAAVRRVAEHIDEIRKVSEADLPMAGGEDFAYFTQTIPGAYFFLGAGHAGQENPGCHHPDFDFEDQLIPLGLKMMVGIVIDRLTP
ncbi:MAG: amidohydrolase [Myxococcales bacterium]|nr:amidohydrolase [Myxococcales bacterium]